LQRQCSCGKHTIAGGVCTECQQNQGAASQVSAEEVGETRAPVIQTFPDYPAGSDFSAIPAHTTTTASQQIIQPKLTVNAPDDQYEQEADKVAETVMRMLVLPSPPLNDIGSSLNPSASHLPSISHIQTSGGSGTFQAPINVEARINQMQGSGHGLPDTERDFFESRMGYDFSGVRVHTDASAVQASRDIQARAFTMGNNIAFNKGAYLPGTSSGRRLLAHELTHVVQQTQARQIQRQNIVAGKSAEESAGKLEEEEKKPKDLDHSEAAEIGREVLQTIGYEKLMQAAMEAGLLERSDSAQEGNQTQRKGLDPNNTVFREATTFGAVFARWALTAGVVSQLDTPAPGPMDAVAIGILAVGLVVAGATVLMSSSGNVADTGIMEEVQALIAAGTAATVCAGLALLMAAARRAGDKIRIRRIKKTQKDKGCRHSRHS
jgi:hypothetical protein